jgi:hypothetical protein
LLKRFGDALSGREVLSSKMKYSKRSEMLPREDSSSSQNIGSDIY